MDAIVEFRGTTSAGTGGIQVVGSDANEHHPPVPVSGSVLAMLQQRYGTSVPIAKAKLRAGEYYPRMWRPLFSPSPSTTHQLEWTMSVQAARNLFLDMRDVFRCVEPSTANADAYGHRIREQLM